MANDFSRFFFLDVRCGNQIPINATVVLNANIWENNSSAAAAAATMRLVYVSSLSLYLETQGPVLFWVMQLFRLYFGVFMKIALLFEKFKSTGTNPDCFFLSFQIFSWYSNMDLNKQDNAPI